MFMYLFFNFSYTIIFAQNSIYLEEREDGRRLGVLEVYNEMK